MIEIKANATTDLAWPVDWKRVDTDFFAKTDEYRAFYDMKRWDIRINGKEYHKLSKSLLTAFNKEIMWEKLNDTVS